MEMQQMSTDDLKAWYKELCEALEDMEYGSYEYDCTDLELQYVSECLAERGVK